MSRRTMTIYGQTLLSEASLKRMTKAELIEYALGLQDSYRISEECRELGAREAEKLLNMEIQKHLIKCKDCKWCEKRGGILWCNIWHDDTNGLNFCSYAERRADEHTD